VTLDAILTMDREVDVEKFAAWFRLMFESALVTAVNARAAQEMHALDC
jgi:hypothetical protein